MTESFSQFKHIPGYLCIKNALSQCLYINDEFSALVGFSDPHEFVSLGGLDEDLRCRAAENAPIFIQEDKAVIRLKRPMKILGLYAYSDGDLHAMYTTKTPYYDGNEVLSGVICHAYDMTHSPILNLTPLYEQLREQRRYGIANATFYIDESIHDFGLTNKQKECLFHTIRGYSARETAEKLNISRRTIEFHLDNIKDKFSVSTKSELIEKAIAYGFLNMFPSSLLCG